MKRHRFDPFSLLFGALFVSVGISFLLGSTIGEARRSVWPILAIIAGCTLAAWAIAGVVRGQRPPATEPVGAGRNSPEPASDEGRVVLDAAILNEEVVHEHLHDRERDHE